jgi:conjugal transfer ATP-binding protein TraC
VKIKDILHDKISDVSRYFGLADVFDNAKDVGTRTTKKYIDDLTLGAVSISQHLQYRSFVSGADLFLNEEGVVGFILELSMIVGSDDTLEKNLNLFFNNELPEGSHLQFLLIGSSNLEGKFKLWREGRKSGKDKMLDQITQYREAYLREKAQDLGNGDGRVGRDYRLYLSFSIKLSNDDRKKLDEVSKFKEKLTKKLEALKLYPRSCNAKDLAYIVQDLLRMELTPLIKDRIQESDTEHRADNQVCQLMNRLSDEILNGIEKLHIKEQQIEHLDRGLITRGYYPQKLPEEFSLMEMIELLGPDSEGGIPARLIISYTVASNINKADESKILSEGHRSIHASEKWYARHDISLQKEASWWREIIDRNKNGEKFLTENLQIFITSPKNSIEIAEEKLKSHYNSLDFQLARNDKLHLIGILSILPMHQANYWKTLKFFKLVKNVPAREVVAKLPIHGEWKGVNKSGVLLIGRKGEIFNWNPYCRVGGAGNYNVCVMAPSGSGKSFFLEELVTSLIAQDVTVFVLDIGGSYQNISEGMEKSEYIRFNAMNNLSLNPFASLAGSGAVYIEAQRLRRLGKNLDEIGIITGLALERLEAYFLGDIENKDQHSRDEVIEVLKVGEHYITKDALMYAKSTISTMCGVSGDNVKEAVIERGISDGILKHGQELDIDKFVTTLENSGNNVASEIALSLYPYTSRGMHGRYFKSGNNAKFDASLTVFEFEEIKGDEVFLSVILGIILMQVTMQFLCGDRSKRFALIVDEAWKIIDHSVGFLEGFARTVRKYGGSLITCVQEYKDLDKGPRHQALLNNSSWTAVLRQEAAGIGQMRDSEKFKNCIPLMSSLVKDPENKYSEILLMSSGLRVVGRLVVDPYSEALYSTEGEDYHFLIKCKDSGMSKDEAIKKLIARKGKILPDLEKSNKLQKRQEVAECILV